MSVSKLLTRLAIIAGLLIVAGSATYASVSDPKASSASLRWFTSNPKSTDVVDHSQWNKMLVATVHVSGDSRAGGKSYGTRALTGSRLKGKSGGKRGGNNVNRIPYKYLVEKHLGALRVYTSKLQKIKVSELNRNEQLAFWLNLHNATVYKSILENYPIRKVESLREGGRGEEGIWSKKLARVEGVLLSLDDIREKILFRVWSDPLVLYGLYDGSQGSPDILNRAYTGENVEELLNINARRFVNGNRGVRNAGRKDIKVSQIYVWGQTLFPGGDDDLIAHLENVASPYLQGKLERAQVIDGYFYDWRLNDLKKFDTTFQDKLNNIGRLGIAAAPNN